MTYPAWTRVPGPSPPPASGLCAHGTGTLLAS